MKRPPHRALRIFCAVFLLPAALTAQAADGTIPNQSYPSSEVFKMISPQLGARHMNQPSVINGYAIFAGNAEHEVWDISNPYAPQHLADMLSHYAAGEAESHQVTYARRGNTLYMATVSGRGVDIWDVTDTPHPELVSEIVLPGINYGDVAGAVWGLSWDGNYLYAGATTNGIYVLDVTDVTNPQHVASVPTSALGGVTAGPIFALGNLLIITTPKEHRGIATVDISDPTDPRLLDSVAEGANSYIGGFYGTNAYLITPYRAYDVTTDPSNIQKVAQFTVPNSEYMSFGDDRFFLGGLRGGTEGIWKYNITDPTTPSLEGRYVGRDSRWDDQFSCPVGNLLLVADDQLVDNKYVGGLIAVHSAQPDTTPPHVKYVNPPNGAVQQPVTSRIGISLSDWPELTSVDASTFIVRPVGGAPVAGTWGCTTTTLTFGPSQPLEPDTVYEIVLPAGGITDLVGNPIAAEFRSTFKTATSGGFRGNDEIESVLPTELGQPTVFKVKNPSSSRLYEWLLPDDVTLTGSIASYIYPTAGWKNVTLRSNWNTTQSVEAEDAILEGGVVIAADNAGYTGSGYADYPSGTGASVRILCSMDFPLSTTAPLKIRYANGGTANRPLRLSVNGGALQVVNFPVTGAWTKYSTVVISNVPLQLGTNSFELQASAGSAGPNIDSLSITFEYTSIPTTTSFKHLVFNPVTTQPPTGSSPLALDHANDMVWAANSDAGSITAVDLESLTKVREVPVGAHPETLAVAPDGKIWVANRDSWSISVVTPTSGAVETIPLTYASQPSGLAFAPDGSAAYVTLQAIGQVLKIDPSTRSVLAFVNIPSDADGIRPQIHGVSVDASSEKVYVTRFISPSGQGEVFEIDAATMQINRVLALAPSVGPDTPMHSRGIPNYLLSMTISPDGLRGWLPSKLDNIYRGSFRDGLALDHDVTVRGIASQVNLSSGSEVFEDRIDFDDQDRAQAVTFSPLGDLAFVSMPGNNHVSVLDSYTGDEVARLPVGIVPVASVIDEHRKRLITLNFLSRSLSVTDVEDLFYGGSLAPDVATIPLVLTEPLAPQVLRGKILFYDATSTRLNSEHYMSCASCHLDGSNDGRTWDLTSLGEGLRNTIDLRGHGGTRHGRLHWSGNFDEVHDFENQIRALGLGEGLMTDAQFFQGTRSNPLGMAKAGVSDDLDALAVYVGSLDTFQPSPYRNGSGELTSQAEAGRQIFNSLRCYDCHGGKNFTDSRLGALHDVGTIKASSGTRIGGPLTGLDTPTLRGVWATAPYLHDGSAPTLRDVLTTSNPNDKHGVTSSLSSTEIDQLVAYLQQIDGSEPAASAPAGLDANTYENFIAGFPALSGQNADGSVDYDGDEFSNLAEFALGGTNPTQTGSRPELVGGITTVDGDEYFIYSYLRLKGGHWSNGVYRSGNVVYHPEATADFATWSVSVIELPNPDGLGSAPQNYEWGTFGCRIPADRKSRFVRIEVSAVPSDDL